MPASTPIRQRPRALVVTAAAVPLALAAAVVDNVRVRRRLEAARRDPLTGLPCRDRLTDHVATQLADRHCADSLLVVVLDGNGFKQINDRFGHAAGDQVVITLGQRLSQWCTAHRGVAARLGGDEFGAVARVPRTACETELADLRARMDRPVTYKGQELPFSVAIGAAHSFDLPGCTWSTLLRTADMAMYRVKRGEVPYPYLGTPADAATPTVNGRRPGRPGTHLPVPATA